MGPVAVNMRRAYMFAMSTARPANIVGALALGLADDILADVTNGTRLSATEAAALALIDSDSGMSINSLRLGLALSHPGAVRLVDRLVTAGLVQRVSHDGDQRAVSLELTSAGAVTCATTLARRDGAIRRALAALTRDEQAMIGALGAKMLRAILQSEAHASRICRLCDHRRCTQCPIEAELQSRNA